jgi:hypothetical protein
MPRGWWQLRDHARRLQPRPVIRRSYGGSAASWGSVMQTIGLPKASKPTPETSHGPLDFELSDLYVAIFIVVPLALFLKSLWS